MKKKITHTLVAVLGSLTASHAAIINIPDHSFTPDGSGTESFINTALEPLNGGSSVLPSSGTTAYVISTFTFGTGSDAHLRWQFYRNAPTSAARMGLEIRDDGSISIPGTGGQLVDYDALTNQSSPSAFSFGQDMAGETVTMLAKFQFDTTNSDTYNVRFNNNSAHGGADTLMNVWYNPTLASVEGAGPSAGDQFAIWNSSGFRHFRTSIFNQSTPGTAGDSSILNTVILTGNDATFANALAIAAPVAIPEPSSLALLGMGSLALLRRRRRR